MSWLDCRALWVLPICWLSGCGADANTDSSSSSADEVSLPAFDDVALDTYGLAVEPDPSVFGELLGLEAEPVVMVNLLRYRDDAVGADFAGLTGQEAYQQYVDAIEDTQTEIGSRLIWAGEVETQVVGISDPVFHTVGLLEYVSVDAFLGYAAGIPAEAQAARAAGLEGQWLVAATTESEDDGELGDGQGCATWTVEAAAEATGLSTAQLGRLPEGGGDQPVVVVELVRSSEGGSSLEGYLDTVTAVQAEMGARTRWRGALQLQVLGSASPGFEQLIATEYPSTNCWMSTLADRRVTAVAQDRAEGVQVHWLYTATSIPGL